MNGGSFVDNLWKNINDVQALHGNIFKSHDKSSHVIISKSFHWPGGTRANSDLWWLADCVC
jgi:hypothetical protein